MSTRLDSQIQGIARRHGLIVLYHSVAQQIPSALGNTLHNVSVDQMNRHLLDLSDYFQFVSLDEFSKASSKAGLAAITFDDGYKNVIQNAVPLLASLNYPFTLFLNPITFENRWNWRDKVRYLIHHRQIDEFLRHCTLTFSSGRFYRYSKNPANNSKDLDLAISRFLKGQQIDIYDNYPYLSAGELSARELIDQPLLSYGNHSQNHYVLASLDDDQQKEEIEMASERLGTLGHQTLSECFSAPFGGSNDINSTTLKICAELQYTSVLMSRQQLQPAKSLINKVQILERFMPRSDNIIDELVSACTI